MKRVLVLILALSLSLPLIACNKDGNGGAIKGDAYTARQSHLYPYADPLRYDDYDYSVVIDGDKAQIVQYYYDSETNDDGDVKITEITKLTGSVKLENGYCVVTVKKLYNSVKLSGAGASAYKNEMISMAKEQLKLLDPEDENYKEYKQRFEIMIELYSGKEVDVTTMTLSSFESVVYKLKLDDKNMKITEMLMLADEKSMGGYTFEYNANGVMTRSTELDGDGDILEAEYRANGTPSSFKYTTDEEVLNFTCDENGNITEITGD